MFLLLGKYSPICGIFEGGFLRLLTGYAVTYNQRHKRHDHLFQNRYKSILCQEEPYLLELVRYIHLNPLRAKVVPDMDGLDSYPYAGHRVLLGGKRISWQEVATVLSRFGGKTGIARRRYREFMKEGVRQGQPAVSTAVQRGETLANTKGWRLSEE